MFDTNQSVFDSREVIERIDELEAIEVIDRDEDEQEELDMLTAFAAEASDYIPDWQYGEAFVNEDYFEEYAEELAYDWGFIDRDATWPLKRIDWAAAADDLKIDYTSLELDGSTYWARGY